MSDFRLTMTEAEYKVAVNSIRENALLIEHDAMNLYGAKDSFFDRHCYFEDFFKLYANERVAALESQLGEAHEVIGLVSKPLTNQAVFRAREYLKNFEVKDGN